MKQALNQCYKTFGKLISTFESHELKINADKSELSANQPKSKKEI